MQKHARTLTISFLGTDSDKFKTKNLENEEQKKYHETFEQKKDDLQIGFETKRFFKFQTRRPKSVQIKMRKIQKIIFVRSMNQWLDFFHGDQPNIENFSPTRRRL